MLAIVLQATMVLRAANPKSQALSQAVSLVDKVYQELKTLSVTSSESFASSAAKARLSEEDYYFIAPADQDAPNEFNSIGYGVALSQKRDITVLNHVNYFYQMFKEAPAFKNCSFSYLLRKSAIAVGPEFKKGEAPISIAMVIMMKRYSRGGVTFKEFQDTLQVDLEQMKVSAWTNETSKDYTGYAGSFGTDSVNLYHIRQKIEAANFAYDEKQYEKAYKMYEDIVRSYPREAEAYYRMAVMLFEDKKNKHGLCPLKGKERNDLILDYLHKAVSYGHNKINTSKRADNMRYWITS